MLKLAILLLVLSLSHGPPATVDTPTRHESIADYEQRELVGWTVFINRALIRSEPALLDHVLLALADDLTTISASVKPPQLAALRGADIWIERQGAVVPGGMSGRGMCFHPDRNWLTSHGLLAQKAGGIEIIRAADFVPWRRNQPMMTFHELAHAYNHHLGFDLAEVRKAYQHAMEQHLYDAVAYNMSPDGEPVRAYAANNQREYFAELSEAYFGLNDYAPFTRVQLKNHDPAGYAMIERLWSLSADEIEQLHTTSIHGVGGAGGSGGGGVVGAGDDPS